MVALGAGGQARCSGPRLSVLVAVSFWHLLNDIMQSLLASLYPLLKTNYDLDFVQIGLLTLAFQVTASLLQPVVGVVTDRWPMPYSLPVGMASTLCGLLLLGNAHGYPMLRARGLPDRARLGGLPSRGVAGGAPRLRRAARLRAVAVPGRRQYRQRDRAAARRLHRAAARPGERRLVRRDRACSGSSS